MIRAFVQMPIENQTWIVLIVGWFMLAVSAGLREKMPPGECRNWARAMGVVGVALMSLQLIKATSVAEKLSAELMVRKGAHDATSIADPIRVVAIASEFSCDVNGTTLSFTRFSDGRIGPVSASTGRGIAVCGRDSSGLQRTASGNGIGRATNSGFDDVPNAKSVTF